MLVRRPLVRGGTALVWDFGMHTTLAIQLCEMLVVGVFN